MLIVAGVTVTVGVVLGGGFVDPPPPPPQPAISKLPAIHSQNAACRPKLLMIALSCVRAAVCFYLRQVANARIYPFLRASAIVFSFCAGAIVSRLDMVSKSFSHSFSGMRLLLYCGGEIDIGI
jgi:hypothetical protein